MQHLAMFWLLTIWWKYAGNVIGLINTFYSIFHTIVYFQKISVLSIDTMKYNEQQCWISCDMHIPVQIWMMMTRNHIQSFCMLFYSLYQKFTNIQYLCFTFCRIIDREKCKHCRCILFVAPSHSPDTIKNFF